MPAQDPFEKANLDLFIKLLIKDVENRYRGRVNIKQLKTKITSDGFFGGTVKIIERDPDTGFFYEVEREVVVLDDMGEPIYGPEDIGGQCVKGEIVKRGSLYKCVKCGRRVCPNHVKFLGDDQDKPYCDVGFIGCYNRYRKLFNRAEERRQQMYELGEETQLEGTKTTYLGEHLGRRRAEKQVEDYERGIKPSFWDWLIGSPVPRKPIRCPHCGWSPSAYSVTCENCGTVFSIRADTSRRCPLCDYVVTEVECFRCHRKFPV
jgi:DNA-directed RNA polymerase subunit RPC12/RpoP